MCVASLLPLAFVLFLGLVCVPYPSTMSDKTTRHLLILLGDQMAPEPPVLVDAEPERDRFWMCEAAAEATHVPSHKARTVLFLSAMRHCRARLVEAGWPVRYLALDEHEQETLGDALAADLAELHPERVRVAEPGEQRVVDELTAACEQAGVPLDIVPDDHFICSRSDFDAWAEGRKELRQENFYRWLRKREDVLMDGGEPAGGAWNFDKSNRKSFGKQGPGTLPPPASFRPDALTREVVELVERRFPDAPGRLDRFDWPVTPEQAEQALADFIDQRLPAFGPYQDAMWTGEPFLYHAKLSAAFNLHLLDPRAAVDAAEHAHRQGHAPLNAAEGFIRQLLGWREYVRGVYWRFMPEYLDRNFLDHHAPLPDFFWTARTDMRCLAESIGQTLEHGYAHHIQRLMVLGLYAMLRGVDPAEVHKWFLAVYVDAVEWAELPNVAGMSQFADGGVMASKPYAASGKYINRMSNYCRNCPYNPEKAVGDDACPFTTLYWDFLQRHKQRLADNPRMRMQLRNLDRKPTEELRAVRRQADQHRAETPAR